MKLIISYHYVILPSLIDVRWVSMEMESLH